MTLTQAQTILHALYQGDDDTPINTSDDWAVRTTLLGVGVDEWEQEITEWRELYTTLLTASDGDKTTVASTATYNCPTNFIRPVGFLRIDDGTNTHYYPRKEVDGIQLFDDNTTEKFYYVTGSASAGFSITIHPTPDDAYTVSYEYYKRATKPTGTTDIFEMSDPYFAIYYALSVLHENDGAGLRAEKALAQASSRMQIMKSNNFSLGAYQDDFPGDVDFDLGVTGFGT